MNLTQPPFDDIHVRRAMNWVMDKTALVQAWGGPLIGKVANHIVPDTLLDDQLADYAPYATPGDHGSVAKAKAAMKGSKYDTKRRRHVQRLGLQERAAARRHARRSTRRWSPVIQAERHRRSGSPSRCARSTGAYPAIQTPSKNIPIGRAPRLGQGLRRRATPSSTRSSTAARSSRPATRTTRSSGSRRRRRRRCSGEGQPRERPERRRRPRPLRGARRAARGSPATATSTGS